MTSDRLRHEDGTDHDVRKGRSVICVTLVTVVMVAVGCLSAQQPAAPAVKFDSTRAYNDLRQMVGFGPRPSGSATLTQTREYIKKELAAAGLQPEELPFDARTPAGVIHMVNVRATLPGPTGARGRLVIGGHYDTKRAAAFSFVGASDGASSAAFLLELARALKGRVNALPIELLFLDGEEAVVDWNLPKAKDHTYGSRRYVEELQQSGQVKDVRAFVLVDMIGDRELNIRREQNSTPWLTDIVWNAARRLKKSAFLEESTPIEDDHLEFLEAGIPSVDIIDLDYPAWHTADDDLAHVAASSLQTVGDVLLAALPEIESRLK
ncbi:MAG: M28 family peptidase [Vicinamibacterales bacterium]